MGLIRRFSEDIDFKIEMPKPASRSAGEKQRRAIRSQMADALKAAGFVPVGAPLVGDEGRFMSAIFDYGAHFPANAALRPELKVELTFSTPALPAIGRQVQSFVAKAEGKPPEVTSIACVDPVETGADKLSALAWRVLTRERGSGRDDPTIVRHLHDLAALEPVLAQSKKFGSLVQQAAIEDAARGGGKAPADATERFAAMLEALTQDELWAREYDTFVGRVSFAPEEQRIGFEHALEACRRLVSARGVTA